MSNSKYWIRGLSKSTAISLVLACAAAATPWSTALAQGGDTEEIIVTARKRAERLIDVPVAATSVSKDDLARYNTTSLLQIQSSVPQVRFDRGFTGAGVSISMRGISSSNLDPGLEQSVLVDIDGMPTSRGRVVNDALFDLESVDVLKGPQALFFGKNSPGGVVALRSAMPTSTFEGYFRAGYETEAQEKSFEGAISGPLTSKLNGRLAVFTSSSEGYIRNNNPGIAVDPFRTPAFSVPVPAAPHTLGAEDKYAGRLTLAAKPTDNLDVTLKVLYAYYEGQGTQSFTEIMSCANGVSPLTNGRADPFADCKLNNVVSQGTVQPDIVATWPQVRDIEGGKPYSRNRTLLPTLTLNYNVSDITFTSVTGYYNYDFVTRGQADASAYSLFYSYNFEKNSSFTQEVRATSSFASALNFTTGLFYENDVREYDVGARVNANPVHTHDNTQNNHSSSYSVFGQLSWKILPNLELAGGARFSHERRTVDVKNLFVDPAVAAGFLPVGVPFSGSHKEDNLSPEGSLTWHPTHNLTLYGAYKTGWLSGGFSNPGTLTSAFSITKNTFSAEKVKGEEIGAKWSLLDNRFKGDLVFFNYDYKNLPLTGLVGITFVTTNAASTNTKGVELNGSYDVGDGLTLRGGASFNNARFDEFKNAQCFAGQTAANGCSGSPANQNLTGRRVYRAPEWLANIGATYDMPVWQSYRLQMTSDLRYNSGYYANLNLNPGSVQDSFFLVDASLRLYFPDEKWSVAVIGRNLADVTYATLGNDKVGGVGDVMATAGNPRAILLQLTGGF